MFKGKKIYFLKLIPVTALALACVVPTAWSAQFLTPLPKWGGKICGPNDITGYTLPDAVIFPWVSSKGSGQSKARFAGTNGACTLHDICYEDLARGRVACTRANYRACNDAFKANLYKECESLKKGCQRKLCKSTYADVYYSAVAAVEDKYYNKHCK